MARPDFTKKWASSRPSIPEIASPDYAQGFANYLGAIPPSTDDHDYIMNLQDERAVWLDENKAPLASPTFTGDPAAPTPAQFDNDTSLATTAFVQQALGSLRGLRAVLSATTLTAADVGLIVQCNNAGYNITLPAAGAVPAGGSIHFRGYSGGVITIIRAGADSVSYGAGTGYTSIPLTIGGSLTLVSNGSDSWMAVAGSDTLPYSTGLFGSSLAASGYQKLPSGLIIQWGTVSVSSTGSGVTGEGVVTFPVTFPNAALSISASYELTGGAITGALGLYHRSLSASGVRFGLDEASATSTTTSVKWIAIGN